jgi:peroxiredoxin
MSERITDRPARAGTTTAGVLQVARHALGGALLAVVALLPVAAFAAGGLVPWNGGAAPALALQDLAGREVRLADLRGRTVVVNFWATWCAPCVAEMPSLQALHESLADDGVRVLAVNMQENPSRVRAFVERLALTFTVVRDPDGRTGRAWGARALPTSFVIAPDGRVALVAMGEVDWAERETVARVRELAKRGRGAGIQTASADRASPLRGPVPRATRVTAPSPVLASR